MKLLHVVREYAEARSATWPRRLYGCALAVILIGLFTAAIVARLPVWVFWTALIVEAIFDTFLVHRWIARDAAARAMADQL